MSIYFIVRLRRKINPVLEFDDFYAVCGQTQKSVRWRRNVDGLFKHLQSRGGRRTVSRFEKGDLQQLSDLQQRSRFLTHKFRIFIIQPGLDVHKVKTKTDILNLLGATDLYLKEAFAVPLTIIGSGNGAEQ